MNSLPATIEKVFEELRNEIHWVHAKWMIYRELFDHSDERIDLLNECASAFFYFIEQTLFGDVLLSIAKITDPARTGKRENLTLYQLQEQIETFGEEQFSSQLRKLLADLNTKSVDIRAYRNKSLAHFDLATAMRSAEKELSISRQMVEDALSLVREYMNTIQTHYSRSEAGYQYFILQTGSEALVTMLKFGLRYDQLVRDEKISWEDIQNWKSNA